LEFLSNIQLYYSSESDFSLAGDEAHHVLRVMRHRIGDKIFITNGKGVIRESQIFSFDKEKVFTQELSNYYYENELKHIHFCIPILKNPDRLSFAIEKAVELGITNFILYPSGLIAKKEIKLDRYFKIGTAAMKQSLRAFLPNFTKISALEELIFDKFYYFDQNGTLNLNSTKINREKPTVFIFGSESGFNKNEQNFLQDKYSLKLTQNRLRSETAIVVAASVLSMYK
jgi:16S rRNA (uracil1498-N3)-methyltransferase